MDNAIKVRTFHAGGKIVTEVDAMGLVTRRVADVVALQTDEAFRAALVKLGWAPPETALTWLPMETALTWLPMETAPRTGRTMILLLTPSGWPQVAWSDTWWMGGHSVECKPLGWYPIPNVEPSRG